jgi:hypothetical protein
LDAVGLDVAAEQVIRLAGVHRNSSLLKENGHKL